MRSFNYMDQIAFSCLPAVVPTLVGTKAGNQIMQESQMWQELQKEVRFVVAVN